MRSAARSDDRATRPATPSERVKRKSARKRDDIVAAATRVLNARTYALATMTEIAAELDMRDGALYYYFSSKQALFHACLLRSAERFERYLDLAEIEGATGMARLERFLFHLVDDSARTGPLLYFGDYFHLDPEQREGIARRADDLTARLEAFLRAGIADGSIAPCETRLVVQLLMGMLIWLAKWTPGIADLTVDRLLAAMGVVMIDGLANRGSR